MFLMLTGQLPFAADNQFALRDAKLFNDPPRPRDLSADISKKLEEVILKSVGQKSRRSICLGREMRVAVNALREGVTVADLTEAVTLPRNLGSRPRKSRFRKLSRSGHWRLSSVSGCLSAVLEAIRPALPKPPQLLSPETAPS